MVTICAMTATIMQALDTTIANVALPYMQGTLSASQDQINWVLTSYIVAAAIMTAPVGWIANRFGRKRIFIVCSAGFTVASVMCGLAQDITQMVVFRLLQGVFGAALVPLSQAVMLDSYALHERAKAMAIWGMGVMMGPIMGPSLGAWLTETYSWHWVFFVNLPFGVITVLGLVIFMDESQVRAEATSLLAIVPVALVAVWRQLGYGNVRVREGLVIGALSPLGVAIGVVASNEISQRALELIFAGLALVIASQLVVRALRPAREPRG